VNSSRSGKGLLHSAPNQPSFIQNHHGGAKPSTATPILTDNNQQQHTYSIHLDKGLYYHFKLEDSAGYWSRNLHFRASAIACCSGCPRRPKAATSSPNGARIAPKRSFRCIGMCTGRKRCSNGLFSLSHWRLLIDDDRLPGRSVSPSVSQRPDVGYESKMRRWIRDASFDERLNERAR
jgi:hypothetical protein